MIREAIDKEGPDRLYIITGGRASAPIDTATELDLVTLILSEAAPEAGMQSEYARILQICRRPTAVVELGPELDLPVSVVRILLADLLRSGKIAVRQPSSALTTTQVADTALLERLLDGLKAL